MIALVALALAADPSVVRARAQLLVAAWAEARDERLPAERAATTALLHDPDAAAPRALLARLREGEPGGNAERRRWLEEAVLNPEADAATWTALGRARAALGDAEGAAAAYAESEARGPSSANYAAWFALMQAGWAPQAPSASAEVLRIELTARWLALAEPGGAGRALRATWADSPAPGVDGQACTDADLAIRLGEAVDPLVVVRRCGRAGRIRTATRALDRLGGRVPADALAAARTHLAHAAQGVDDELSSLRALGYPAATPSQPELCPWLRERWPTDARLRAACVSIGGWPP